VAAAAGVSRTAVSFAFNDPARISEATRKRILEVADDLGYRPDTVARMLSHRRTGSLGVLLPQGIPEVMEHFPPSEVVRLERDAVVTHAVIVTDDAPGLAALLVSEVELCEQEDDRVTDASWLDLGIDAPPTDAFRLHADVELLDLSTDGVWAITAADATHVSVVGASVSDLFEDPEDPLELVRDTVGRVYTEPDEG
jgi:hypothetical protein